jgi:HAE1 family hydrophobic/amphiphilic exporter-1
MGGSGKHYWWTRREIQVSLDAIKMQGMAFRFRATGNLSSNLDFPTGNIQTREKKS